MNTSDIDPSVERLTDLISIVPAVLEQISEAEFSFEPPTGKWSRKQILGHLIDSATNNHQRFIRIQYEEEPTIYYDQDKWNSLNYYNQVNTKQLIDFWKMYNRHLLTVIKQIPPENLERKGFSKFGEKQTLQWYITDYVKHLEHHLQQITAPGII